MVMTVNTVFGEIHKLLYIVKRTDLCNPDQSSNGQSSNPCMAVRMSIVRLTEPTN